MRINLFVLFWIILNLHLSAQQTDIEPTKAFYLGSAAYNPSIAYPAAFLGWEPGTWHVTPEQAYAYYDRLDSQSERILRVDYGKTWEKRSLAAFIITHPDNHARLEDIRRGHLKISDPKAPDADLTNELVVLWQGFSVHGNEPSGGNAALLYVYHLVASESPEVLDYLKQTIVIVDPIINPDGFARFANWANSRKSTGIASADPADMEHNEPWPRGRTNHYFFDLNRDWLPLVHPESNGRMQLFKSWMPNVLTDHHEMGTNATFFFQPGVPSRTNPLTPKKNMELTGTIAGFHAEAFDAMGSYYYTKENFDDFYYGKGSTYPDIQGAVGILFEQASSRGHRQESIHGVLSFPFTIKNQLTAANSTLKAAFTLRKTLLEHQHSFFKTALEEASKDPVQAYIIGDVNDMEKIRRTANLLKKHNVECFELAKPYTAGGITFTKESSFLIPSNQAQYKLIKSLFTRTTKFEDSLFYDISAWTLPFAIDAPFVELDKRTFSGYQGNLLTDEALSKAEVNTPAGSVGFYVPPGPWNFHRLLSDLLENGLLVKVITAPAQASGTDNKMVPVPSGSLFIPASGQPKSVQEVASLLQNRASTLNVPVLSIKTGYAAAGIDAGSPSALQVKAPVIAIVGGEGTVSNDMGELWHLLDAVQDVPVTLLPVEGVNSRTLLRYNRIILPNGSYGSLSKSQATAIKDWIRNGGTLVAVRGAVNWLATQEIAPFDYQEATIKPEQYVAYNKQNDFSGSQEVAGAIFEATIDATHPLGWGYFDQKLSVFRDHNRVLKPSANKAANPVMYSAGAQQAGWVSSGILKKIQGSAETVVFRSGAGRIIGIADNPNFRSFFTGPNRMFMNAVFFGDLIRSDAAAQAD